MPQPAQRYHIVEICDWLAAGITAAFSPAEPAGLGLVKVQFGSIAHIPTPADIAGILPCVFIEPMILDSAQGPPVTKIANDMIIKIVYCRRFTTAEDAVQTKAKNMLRIANWIMDDFLLRNMVPPIGDGFSVYDGIVNNISFDPPENAFVLLGGSDISAASLTYRVREQGRRTVL